MNISYTKMVDDTKIASPPAKRRMAGTISTALAVAHVARAGKSLLARDCPLLHRCLQFLPYSLAGCYPLAQTHLSLAASARLVWATVSASICRHVTQRQKQNEQRQKIKKNIGRVVFPNAALDGDTVMVGSTTPALIDAFLTVASLPAGAPVFIPGLLTSEYAQGLLEMLLGLRLRVVGYDVDPFTMQADTAQLRRSANAYGLGGTSLVSQTAPSSAPSSTRGKQMSRSSPSTTTTGTSAQVTASAAAAATAAIILLGINGRFIHNAASVHEVANSIPGCLVVEVHAPTVKDLYGDDLTEEGCGTNIAASRGRLPPNSLLHVTAFDTPGLLGGAVGCLTTGNSVLSRAMQACLEAYPEASALDVWQTLARQVCRLCLSSRLDYGTVLSYVALVSRLLRSVREVIADLTGGTFRHEEEAHSSPRSCSTCAQTAVNRLVAPVSNVMSSSPIRGRHKTIIKNSPQSAVAAAAATTTTEHARLRGSLYNSLTTPTLEALSTFLVERREKVDAECYSLWSFLVSLPPHIDVISASAKDAHPFACVEVASDCIVLQAASPSAACEVASRVMRAGFAAVASRVVPFSTGSADLPPLLLQGTARRVRDVQDVVTLPDCPRCGDVAARLVFVPLSPSVGTVARRTLLRAIADLPASLFASKAAGVNDNPSTTTRYSTPQVRAMLERIERRYGGGDGAVTVADSNQSTMAPVDANSSLADALARRHNAGRVRQVIARLSHLRESCVQRDLSEQEICERRAARTASVLFKEATPLLTYMLLAKNVMTLAASKL